MNKSFRRKVEERLAEQNMTQRGLAAQLGVNEVTVSRWLNGDRMPSVETLDRMAQVLGTSASFLLSEDSFRLPQNPQNEKKDNTGLVVTFALILGLVIAAVAAGLLSTDERKKLISELEKDG